MTEKQFNEICSYLQAIVDCLQKVSFNYHKVGAEINTKESLTSQEHYTVQDLIKTFIREKPELLATAKEIDDNDEPDFPTVDAHDDIIDIEEKLEDAELYQSNIQSNSVKKTVEPVEPVEPKNETAVVSESSSTVEK